MTFKMCDLKYDELFLLYCGQILFLLMCGESFVAATDECFRCDDDVGGDASERSRR